VLYPSILLFCLTCVFCQVLSILEEVQAANTYEKFPDSEEAILQLISAQVIIFCPPEEGSVLVLRIGVMLMWMWIQILPFTLMRILILTLLVTLMRMRIRSIVDPHHLDADRDSTYHPDADSDSDFYLMLPNQGSNP
jgi:hypothetical protein